MTCASASQVLLAALLLTALACSSGCRQGQALPADPGLARDALGLGISLGMSADAARKSASSISNPKVSVIAREELLLRDPYAERAPGSDLVVVITQLEEAGEEVAEIRAYLAEPQSSGLELLSRPASGLDAEAAAKAFGAPGRQDSDGSGVSHLIWLFDAGDGSAAPLELTLSFGQDGNCFALAVRRLRIK